uniref:Serine/threonine-protein kinase BSK1-like TPR repeats domain-containing protein n=1 Tax=Oryza rufipogon TaxID=4529 RepID=A0A0E0NF35_ORYRU
MARALDEGDGRRLGDKVGAVRDGNGVGALHLAAGRGSLPVCGYLLEELRVDIDAVEDRGETALTFAINSGNADMVRYLLDHGADTEKLNNDGLTVLHFASGEEVAARCGARKDVETLFPVTSRIPCVHDWTVDGIINYAKSLPDVKDEEFCEAMLDMGKFQGREAVKNKDYRGAMHIYTKAIALNTRDASLFSNRSLCWLKLGEGEKALIDAEACRMMQPNWPEACYRQGAALMLLKVGHKCSDHLLKIL